MEYANFSSRFYHDGSGGVYAARQSGDLPFGGFKMNAPPWRKIIFPITAAKRLKSFPEVESIRFLEISQESTQNLAAGPDPDCRRRQCDRSRDQGARKRIIDV